MFGVDRRPLIWAWTIEVIRRLPMRLRRPSSCGDGILKPVLTGHHGPLQAGYPTKVARPVVHQAALTLEEITARVGRRGGVLYRMGECGLDHFAGCARPFRGPVPEARPEPMRHGGEAEFLGQFR